MTPPLSRASPRDPTTRPTSDELETRPRRLRLRHATEPRSTDPVNHEIRPRTLASCHDRLKPELDHLLCSSHRSNPSPHRSPPSLSLPLAGRTPTCRSAAGHSSDRRDLRPATSLQSPLPDAPACAQPRAPPLASSPETTTSSLTPPCLSSLSPSSHPLNSPELLLSSPTSDQIRAATTTRSSPPQESPSMTRLVPVALIEHRPVASRR